MFRKKIGGAYSEPKSIPVQKMNFLFPLNSFNRQGVILCLLTKIGSY